MARRFGIILVILCAATVAFAQEPVPARLTGAMLDFDESPSLFVACAPQSDELLAGLNPPFWGIHEMGDLDGQLRG